LAKLADVNHRVWVVSACFVLIAGLSACSDETAGTSEPLPTIGLGSGLDVEGDPGALGADGQVADGAGNIDSVVMIGDSITRGSQDELDERFEVLELNSVIEAQNNKRMVVSLNDNPGGAKVASFLADSDGTDGDHSNELWVVALGTNDVGQYASPDEIAGAVNEVLAAVPDDSPLVWVDTYFRDRPEQAEALNTIVRERVTKRGNSVIAPWTVFATSDGVLSDDGVHPTDEGAEVFAFIVTDTVRAFLGR